VTFPLGFSRSRHSAMGGCCKDVSLSPIPSSSSSNQPPPAPPLPNMIHHQKINLSSNNMTNLKMDSYADSLTINNINTNNHVNLVKVQKMKTDNNCNTISLEIISANCYNAFALQKKQQLQMMEQRNKVVEVRDNILKFSVQQQFKSLLSDSIDSDRVFNCIDEIRALHGIRTICLFWIILVHTATFLSYVTRKFFFYQ
jgi:hypothetical protein